jgi:hypothetical protein
MKKVRMIKIEHPNFVDEYNEYYSTDEEEEKE